MLPTYSASSITWIGTTQSFLLMATGIFAGPVFDLGYHRTLLFLGGFLTIFGFMMTSLATEYYQVLLAQGICTGLGSGMVHVPNYALVAASFTTRRAVAIALVGSGISIGACLCFLLLVFFDGAPTSWLSCVRERGTDTQFIVKGGITFNLVFSRMIQRVGFAWTTRTMGLIGLCVFSIAIPMLLCRSIHVSGRRRALIDVNGCKEFPFLILCIGGFFRFLGYFTPVFFIPVFAETALKPPTSQTFSIDLMVLYSAVSLVARLLGSAISTRTLIMLPWTLCSSAAAILCLTWPAVNDLGGFITFIVFYGIISGPLTVFSPAVLPLVCPSPEVIGTRMGMMWGSTAFAILVGTPIAAAISDTTHGHFLGLQLFSGVTLLVGAALLGPLWKPIQTKQKALIRREREKERGDAESN
ncbi:MAG: hypothetical protein Q9191_003233 [Dirinaria sp. TL-2023a]